MGKFWLFVCLALATPALAENSRPAVPAFVEADNPARDIPYPGTLTVDVDATDTVHGVFRVHETVPVSRPGRLTLRFPKWIPGHHAPIGPISALADLHISAGGKPLGWRRDPLDVHAFNVDVPVGVDRIEASFAYLSPSKESQGSVVMTPELLTLQWYSMTLYPAGHYSRQIKVRPSVTLPKGWTGVSALDGAPRRDRLVYGMTDYETLIDSPMFAGRYFREWNLGHDVDLNVVADKPEDLAATPEQIAAHRAMVDQIMKLVGGAKHYDHYDYLLALSDVQSTNGVEHHRSSENSVPQRYFTNWADMGSAQELLAHEFFHSWNGKFRRPVDLWTPDFRTPMQDSLLWVYEGQSSFWDQVLAARGGMMTREAALGEFAEAAAHYSTQAGRNWRPLIDTTNQAIIGNDPAQAYPTYQRGADYYAESALIWLDADTLIREKTGGRKSLDDFVRAFFGVRPGDWGTLTYTFDDVVRTMNAILPYDWRAFFTARIYELAPPPLDGITRGGYRLVYKAEPNPWDAARMRRYKTLELTYSLGMTLAGDGDIDAVVWESPAFKAGIASRGSVVAVNGKDYSADEMKQAVASARTSAEPIRLLIREGARYRDVAVDYHGGLRYPRLEPTGKGPALLDALLEPRRQ